MEDVVESSQGGLNQWEVAQEVGGGCSVVDVQRDEGASNRVLGLAVTDWAGESGRGVVGHLLHIFLLPVTQSGILLPCYTERDGGGEVFIEELIPVLGVSLSDSAILGAAKEGIWCLCHVRGEVTKMPPDGSTQPFGGNLR